MSEPFRFRRSVEVRFRDIDEMGHAHHTLPLIYMEEARSAYWREVLGRPELDFIMGEVGVRFHRRIRYPSTVSVGVRATRIGGRSLSMVYDIREESGEVLADGWSKQVMYDYAAGESIPVSPAMRARIADYEPAEVEGASGPSKGAAARA